jgi:hypothetical protein
MFKHFTSSTRVFLVIMTFLASIDYSKGQTNTTSFTNTIRLNDNGVNHKGKIELGIADVLLENNPDNNNVGIFQIKNWNGVNYNVGLKVIPSSTKSQTIVSHNLRINDGGANHVGQLEFGLADVILENNLQNLYVKHYNGASYTNSLSLLANGNVGVGLPNPLYKFQVTTNNESLIGIRLDMGKMSLGGGSEFSVDANGILGGRFLIQSNGNVGIGTTTPLAKLTVNGNLRATEIRVMTDVNIPDYVFEPSYFLRSLTDVERYIKENKHLPEIPSAREIRKDGIDVATMDAMLLKKIEEITLYMIEMKKEIDVLKEENQQLKTK